MLEHFNAAVDIGTSGGVLGARFLRMPSGWHCESVGLNAWRWGAQAPCGSPKDALKQFADRWLGPGQGLFCSVLSIDPDDAKSTTPGRTVGLGVAPRRPEPIARPHRPGHQSVQSSRGWKIGRLLATATRWRSDGN